MSTALERYELYEQDRQNVIRITNNYLDGTRFTTEQERLIYVSYDTALKNLKAHFNKIDREDLSQEIKARWYYFVKHFAKRPNQYKQINDKYRTLVIIRVCRSVRNYLVTQLNKLQREVKLQVMPARALADNHDEQDLGVNFLVNGSRKFPYSTLSPYDRMLIHLAFYEDMPDTKIAEMLQRNRDTIRQQINSALGYLRTQFVACEPH